MKNILNNMMKKKVSTSSPGSKEDRGPQLTSPENSNSSGNPLSTIPKHASLITTPQPKTYAKTLETKEPTNPSPPKTLESTIVFHQPTMLSSSNQVNTTAGTSIDPTKDLSTSTAAKDMADGILISRASAGSSGVTSPTNTKSHSLTESSNSGLHATIFESLPLLRDTSPKDKADILLKKIELCKKVLDFTTEENIREKEAKRNTLLEIVEAINTTKADYSEKLVFELIDMVSVNIFRSLPPSPNGATPESEEQEPVLEPSWPHLQLVYEILLRFVVSPEVDARTMKKAIDINFLSQFLYLFDSEDPRERDYLKTLLHRIYGKIMAHRSLIRKSIQQVFFTLIHECKLHHGVSELLEILGSIVNGFAKPLKEEHRIFLEKALLPLHKCRSLPTYYQQLAYCMTQYVEKEHALLEPILAAILKYWPISSTSKEVLFLSELEELIEAGRTAEVSDKVLNDLFKKIADCIESCHFQVAERALFLWNNEQFVTFINQHKAISFPVVVRGLFWCSENHWHRTVTDLVFNVSNCLGQTDGELFDTCYEESNKNKEKELVQRKNRESRFKQFSANLEKLSVEV
eukprot:GHVP01035597.1.p1 GENE.GHVP01035597.1~~GHVP01035597.1.p1  ORF type:complete len:587 (+),score=95.14 GHVP01035597.1:35-1762(+)